MDAPESTEQTDSRSSSTNLDTDTTETGTSKSNRLSESYQACLDNSRAVFEGTDSIDFGPSKAFVRGHRRVASSPPIVNVISSSPSGTTNLVRCWSDTDLTDTHAQKKVQL